MSEREQRPPPPPEYPLPKIDARSIEFTDLSEADRKTLARPPSLEELQQTFSRPGFRYLLARVKLSIRLEQEKFFQGAPPPAGYESASARECFFGGLYTANKAVLGFPAILWEEARVKLHAPRERRAQPPREENPFDGAS